MQISQEAEWRKISDKDFRTRRVGLFVNERVFLDGSSKKANWMSYVSVVRTWEACGGHKRRLKCEFKCQEM